MCTGGAGGEADAGVVGVGGLVVLCLLCYVLGLWCGAVLKKVGCMAGSARAAELTLQGCALVSASSLGGWLGSSGGSVNLLAMVGWLGLACWVVWVSVHMYMTLA